MRDSYTPSLVKLGLNLQSVDEIWVYGTDYGGGGYIYTRRGEKRGSTGKGVSG